MLIKRDYIHKDNDSSDRKERNEIDQNGREKACDIFSVSIILGQMLNGYKSRPFDQCKETDQVYKLIIFQKYNSFWNSKYHKNDIKFLEHDYNQFKNNEMIQNLFDYNPNINHHAWIRYTCSNAKLMSSDVYQSELQSISEINMAQNRNIQQNVLLDERGENLMAKFGIKCKYSNENQLPKSSVDQFDGSRIYDENEFLTSLLIRSHLMNPVEL